MSEGQPTISTHVLDTEQGQPRRGVEVSLFRADGDDRRLVGRGTTDDDGRIRRLLDGALEAAEYRLDFRIDGPFFLSMSIRLRITDTNRSYHVPLLMAPYSLATYRGS
jgi:5-hydroxyisourate hydrolase